MKPRMKNAGAGRGFVNPRPVNVSDEDYITPEQEYEMRKERNAARDAQAANREFNKAMPSPDRYAKGGKVSSASSRADGCAVRGKTRGKYI